MLVSINCVKVISLRFGPLSFVEYSMTSLPSGTRIHPNNVSIWRVTTEESLDSIVIDTFKPVSVNHPVV